MDTNIIIIIVGIFLFIIAYTASIELDNIKTDIDIMKMEIKRILRDSGK